VNSEPLVLLPDPAGGPGVALTLPELAEARRRARELTAGSNSGSGSAPNGSTSPCHGDGLLTATELAERTRVPASFWENAARTGTVPHRRFGKRWVRFCLSEVLECPAYQQRAKRVR
jgi:hypothetical protein